MSDRSGSGRRFVGGVLAGALLALVARPVSGHEIGDLDWYFEITEDQVRNWLPNPDGSTDSPAVGTVDFYWSASFSTLFFTISWAGLQGDLTGIHLHGRASPEESTVVHFVDILADEQAVLDAMSASGNPFFRRQGFYSGIAILRPSTGYEHDEVDAILDALSHGQAYVSVETEAFPTGEIRGNACHSTVDVDGDGIGDHCDNCVLAWNAWQDDEGGIGLASAPDDIGDACQCGDVDGDGRVTGLDGTLITRASLSLAPFLQGTAALAAPEKCDVGGTAGCSGLDGTIVKRASLGLSPAIQQVCPAATGVSP